MALSDGQESGLPGDGRGPAGTEPEVARLRAELARTMARVCPAWLADRADDLVQIALMRVLDARRRAEGTAEPSPFYLKKAAYSAVVDQIRSLRRRQEVSLEESVEAQVPINAPDPEHRAVGREIGRAIRDCLGRLARPRRLVVTLHLQGYRVPEAARLLGWSAKRAENLVYRGVADLRRCLEARGVR